MINNQPKDYSLDQVIPGGEIFNFRNWKDVTDYLKVQVKQKGFEFQTTADSTVEFPVSLSGAAKALLGFVVYDPTGNPLNKVSFKINQETRVESVSQCFLSRTFGDPATFQSSPINRLYIPVPSPLAGNNDSMVIIFSTVTAGKNQVVFFYI